MDAIGPVDVLRSGNFQIGRLPKERAFGLRVPLEKLELFGRLYLSGEVLEKAAERAGITQKTALKFTRLAGFDYSPRAHGRRQVSVMKWAYFRRLYFEGESILACCRLSGIGRNAAYHYIKRTGIGLRGSGRTLLNGSKDRRCPCRKMTEARAKARRHKCDYSRASLKAKKAGTARWSKRRTDA